MRAFKVFVFGLLNGWFFKIAFDRIYHQNEMKDIRNENASLKDYIRTLEMQLQSKSLESKSEQGQRSAHQAAPVEAPAERQKLPASAQSASAPEKDDLKVIKGIGPAIEKKLNNAGVQTFAALAKLRARELENILGSAINRLQDENDLVAQAKKLARRR